MKKGYGFDRLSRDMLVLSAALLLLGTIFRLGAGGLVLLLTALALIAAVLFRAFSPRIERRQDELLGYEKAAGAVSEFFKGLPSRFKNRKGSEPGEVVYTYFDCPECGQRMRAPKGRGLIRVTCTKCGNQFEKKV